MKKLVWLIAVSALAADGPRFEGDQLLKPLNYREWVFVTSGSGMTYSDVAAAQAPPEHPPFDNVFVTQAGYKGFVETGTWPDKTMFILEIRASQSKASINKGGHFQGDVIAVEAEVKNGGKWSFYGFGKDGQKAKQMPATAACYSCHAQKAAVDNTFVQFYPTLLPIAKAQGTLTVRAIE